MPIYSEDTRDYIGTVIYRDNDHNHYRAVAPTGRGRLFAYRRDAVEWLTDRYNRTH